VVLTHIAENLHVFPGMGWGLPNSRLLRRFRQCSAWLCAFDRWHDVDMRDDLADARTLPLPIKEAR